MAAGSPVITSNLSSLPEITAGSAVLIDPRSVAELTAAIQRVGEAPDLRARLKRPPPNLSVTSRNLRDLAPLHIDTYDPIGRTICTIE
jgi:glycosyltransferase involved in cell wall biosynthesis